MTPPLEWLSRWTPLDTAPDGRVTDAAGREWVAVDVDGELDFVPADGGITRTDESVSRITY